MHKNSMKPGHAQGLFNLLIVLGLMTMLVAPSGLVEAQAGIPPVPVSPQLTWTDLGPAERAFELNGESVTLSGTMYQSEEAFNLEGAEEIQAYYSTTSLAE